jgi:hypothetical protein
MVPITDVLGRLIAIICGCLMVLGGVGLYLWQQSRKLFRIDPSPYGIKITYPREGDEINIVDVQGVIKRA